MNAGEDSRRPADKLDVHFEPRGSLSPPGRIGRVVRFLIGAWLLSAMLSVAGGGPELVTMTRPPGSWTFWLFVAVAFHLTPYVVNIGFGIASRRRSQGVILAALALLLIVDLVVFERLWAPPLALFLWAWLVYFSAHLGGSFVLSALIRTPGCEMRAIPHLWTIVTGRATREHYCPGPLDRLDRWERSAKS